MAIGDPSATVEAIHQLKQKNHALNQRQAEAIKTATFVGITPDEGHEYDERRKQDYRVGKEMDMLRRGEGRVSSIFVVAEPSMRRGEAKLTAVLARQESRMNRKKRKRLQGTVQKVIKGLPNEPEKAEIGIEEGDELYREIRVENVLTSEEGEKVSLKEGAKVDVVLEADSSATLKKPE